MISQNVPLAVHAKFLPPWLGPYKVLEVRGNTARLDLPPTLGKRFALVDLISSGGFTSVIPASAPPM